MKIVLIGAGNVATHLGGALKKAGNEIIQVFSRTESNAKILADKLNTVFTSDISSLSTSADLYLYCVKDDALSELLTSIKISGAIHVHTAGSLPLSIFENYCTSFGVIYPLQTFSKNKDITFSEIPVFIEANNVDTGLVLLHLVRKITSKSFIINSDQRAMLHLSAVFACNFTNYFYSIASDIVKDSELSFEVLKPLIAETADKIKFLSPDEAQTGPAVRFDTTIIKKHLSMLDKNPEIQTIYDSLSKQIFKRQKK